MTLCDQLYCLFLVITIDTDQSKQNGALIGGATATGGFGLIAFVALVVLFVRYKNKVGDLQTIQDQQLSKRHAYVQDDDVIDKEDTL